MDWQPPPQPAPAGQRITLHDHIVQDLCAIYDAGVPWFTKETIRVIGRGIAQVLQRDWPGLIKVQGLGEKVDFIGYDPDLVLAARLPNGAFVALDLEDLGDNVNAYYLRKHPYLMYHTLHHMLHHLQDHLNGNRSRTLPRPYYPIAVGYIQRPYTLDLQAARVIPSRTFGQARRLLHRVWLGVPRNGTPGMRPVDLARVLATKLRQFPDFRVNKVIGIGCGSFARLDHGSCEIHGRVCPAGADCGANLSSVRSAVLHLFVAALWAFFDVKARTSPRYPGSRARFLLEDQQYVDIDVRVLREEGIEVVTHPESILEVDERSVLVCVEANFPVRQIVADIARPAVIIWERPDDGTAMGVGEMEGLGNGEEGGPRPPIPLDPSSPRVLRMMEEYEMVEFAWDPFTFPPTTRMYIRKTNPRLPQ